MATVITYGTFDLLHIGHLRILQQAKDLVGKDSRLIVAVSSGRFNEVEKGKHCAIPEWQRMGLVGALKCVEQVIPEDSWGHEEKGVSYYGVGFL